MLKRWFGILFFLGAGVSAAHADYECVYELQDRYGRYVQEFYAVDYSENTACRSAMNSCQRAASYSEYCAFLRSDRVRPRPNPPPSRVCGSNQPYPHYGEKHGRCYPSCGHLAGPRAQGKNKPCSREGMRDAGIAYDVQYCCLPR